MMSQTNMISEVRSTGPRVSAQETPEVEARQIIQQSTRNGVRDIAEIDARLDMLADKDPARGAEVRKAVLAQLTILNSVEAGQLLGMADQRTVSLPDGSKLTFRNNGKDQDTWINDLRTAPAGSASNKRFEQLSRLAGGSDNESIKILLKQAYDNGVPPDQLGGIRLANLLTPDGAFAELARFGLESLAKNPDIAKTEWGQRFNTLMTGVSTYNAFKNGLAEGIFNGGKDMVVSLGTFAGKVIQYSADNGIGGIATDALRSLLPSGAQAWMKDQAFIPSAQRGAATTEKLIATATAVKDYIASKSPAQVGADIEAFISKNWEALKADHAKAAAKGPEAEARWFGQITGRAIFEIAATFIPVAGVAGKVTKGVQVADKVSDAVRVVDGVSDATRIGTKVDDVVKVGVRAVMSLDDAARILRTATQQELNALRAAGMSNNKLGPAISVAVDLTTGKVSKVYLNNKIGDIPANFNTLLSDRLGPAKLVDYVKTAGAGSHSEIYAVNELLNGGAKLDNIAVYTEQIGGKFAGSVKPPCPHCNVLLEGVTYVK